MITIQIQNALNGRFLSGRGRIRYVGHRLADTTVDTQALREIICKTRIEAAHCPARMPGDWPRRGLDHAEFERLVRKADEESELLARRMMGQ